MGNYGNGRVWVWVSGGWECTVIERGGEWMRMTGNGWEWMGMPRNGWERIGTPSIRIYSQPFPSWDWMEMSEWDFSPCLLFNLPLKLRRILPCIKPHKIPVITTAIKMVSLNNERNKRKFVRGEWSRTGSTLDCTLMLIDRPFSPI